MAVTAVFKEAHCWRCRRAMVLLAEHGGLTAMTDREYKQQRERGRP